VGGPIPLKTLLSQTCRQRQTGGHYDRLDIESSFGLTVSCSAFSKRRRDMATHKGSSGSNKNGSRKRHGRISRRALIGGLGGGLALTAFGKGQGKSPGDSDALAFEPPVNRSALVQKTFNLAKLSKIVVDSKGMKVTYLGQDYIIPIPEKWTVTLDMQNHTVDYACFSSRTPTPAPPTPESPKKS
jgi:hypothetical protein